LLVTFVPVVFVTPDVVDQYILYDVASDTAVQLIDTCLFPAVTVTPVGADGAVPVGVAVPCPLPQPLRKAMKNE